MTRRNFDADRRKMRVHNHPEPIGGQRVDAGLAWEMGRMTGLAQGDAEGYARGKEEGIGIGVEAGFAAGIDVAAAVFDDLRNGGAKELVKEVSRRVVAARIGAASEVPAKSRQGASNT